MSGNIVAVDNKRNIWLRGLFMLLFGLLFQVCGTVLCIVTVIQFVVTLLHGAPNLRLVTFGRNLGNYLRQIVNFLTFATEELPFPFIEWPADECPNSLAWTDETERHTTMKYRHYKGGNYEIVCEAKLESDPSIIMMVYRSHDGSTWARPKEVFFELVDVDGKSVPRFAPIE